MSNFPWKLLAGPAVLIALVAIGYPVFWHVAAAQLERAVATWADARRADGWEVSHGKPELGGFPFELRIALQRPSLAADPEGWRWQGRRAVLAFQPWDWRRIRIDAHGRQALGIRLEGAWRQFEAEAVRSVFIGAIGDKGNLSDATIAFDGLTLAIPGAARLFAARALHMRFHRAEAGAEAGDGAAAAHGIALRLDRAELAPRYRLPLGQTIARLDLDTRLRGGLPRDLGPAAIEAWRRGGGVVEIVASDLDWGPAHARATGKVTLDERMRPEGSLQAEIQGYDEAVAALEGAGLIRPRDAATARIALGLLARPGPDGRKLVQLPVSAQGGALYLGPVRVLKLRPIPSWAPSARRSPPGASR